MLHVILSAVFIVFVAALATLVIAIAADEEFTR